MGADLIVTGIWTTKPDDIDWDAAALLVPQLTIDDFLDGLEQYADDDVENDTDEAALERARREILTALDEVKDHWVNGRPRDAAKMEFGPVTVLLTGGMSWGDSPTEAYELYTSIPDKVLEAAGFFNQEE